MRHPILLFIVLPTILATILLGASATRLYAAGFSVHDDRANREISEITELYIDEKLVASFHLDDQHKAVTLQISVPGDRDRSGHEPHRYALCGTITVRAASGASETHEVDASGLLPDPDGHHFEALGAENFTHFYLSDPTDATAALSTNRRSGLCRESIS